MRMRRCFRTATTFSLGKRSVGLIAFHVGTVPFRAATGVASQGDRMEATMELAMRLNVLAALLSFGFIAAIVFGMI